MLTDVRVSGQRSAVALKIYASVATCHLRRIVTQLVKIIACSLYIIFIIINRER